MLLLLHDVACGFWRGVDFINQFVFYKKAFPKRVFGKAFFVSEILFTSAKIFFQYEIEHSDINQSSPNDDLLLSRLLLLQPADFMGR